MPFSTHKGGGSAEEAGYELSREGSPFMRKHTRRLIAPFALVLVAAGLLAAAASAAAPRTTSPPTIEGEFQVGETVAAGNGGWANDPVSFDYQWQRCNSAGSGCANITGAMDKSYKLTSAEV